MPLAMRVNPLNVFRRFSSSGSSSNREASRDAGRGSGAAAASEDEGGGTGPGRSTSGRRSRQKAGEFGFTVPQGAVPGETLRVQGPDGSQVEIVLPPNSRPGQKLRVQTAPNGTFVTNSTSTSTSASNDLNGFRHEDAAPTGRGSLNELTEIVRATIDATRASISMMQQRLHDELELQKVLWASAGGAAPCQPDPGASTELRIADARGGGAGGADLSQTQAIVFAAAEAGDNAQLLAALQEAKTFSAVSVSLEEAVVNMKSAEDALVTWRCLLDALEAKDRHEIEVWLEQCRGLGLEVPAGIKDALQEMSRRDDASDRHFEKCREVHRQLQFALEANDLELLTEVLGEAERAGLSQLPVAVEAAERLNRANAEAARSFDPSRFRGPFESRGGAGDAGVWPSQPSWAAEDGPAPPPRGSQHTPGWRPRPNDAPQRNEQPYEQPRAPPPAASEPTDTDPRSVRELLEECKRLGLSTEGAISRADILRILREGPRRASKSSASGPSVATGPGPGPGFGRAPPSGGWSPGPGVSGGFSGGFGANGAAGRSGPTSFGPTGFGGSSFGGTAPPAGSTVWDRKHVPGHLVTKRSKALWLLGFDSNFVGPRITATELRQAYRKAAMESHPDKVQNHSREEAAKDLFQQVKAAYDYLQTPAAGIL